MWNISPSMIAIIFSCMCKNTFQCRKLWQVHILLYQFILVRMCVCVFCVYIIYSLSVMHCMCTFAGVYLQLVNKEHDLHSTSSVLALQVHLSFFNSDSHDILSTYGP